MSAPDSITILRAHRVMAKTVHGDGSVDGYDDAKHYDLIVHRLPDLRALHGLLGRLLSRQDCCVVRGEIIDPNHVRRVRRLAYPDRKTGEAPTMRERPRRWVGLDFDSIPRPAEIAAQDLAACGKVVMATLPDAFRCAAHIVQASGSHGIKPGCRLRVWFWLERPTSGAELTRWLVKMANAPVDSTLFRTVQPIYTAAPRFVGGAVDPLPSRLLWVDGDDLVVVPSPEALAPPTPRPSRPAEPVPKGTNSNHRAQALVTRALFQVRTAPDGQKHPELIRWGRLLGGAIAAAGIGKAEAVRALVDAVSSRDVEDRELAEETAQWAVEVGMDAPLQWRSAR